jgi:hypothetical protein
MVLQGPKVMFAPRQSQVTPNFDELSRPQINPLAEVEVTVKALLAAMRHAPESWSSTGDYHSFIQFPKDLTLPIVRSSQGRMAQEIDHLPSSSNLDRRSQLHKDDENLRALIDHLDAYSRNFSDTPQNHDPRPLGGRGAPLYSEGLAFTRLQDRPFGLNTSSEVILQSPYNATGGKISRSSIHGSLNGIISAHLGGDWGRCDYVVIGNVARIVDRNGPPASLQGVDTFWTRAPGVDLIIPDARVVMPTLVAPDDRLFTIGPVATLYHIDGHFSYHNIKNLVQYVLESRSDVLVGSFWSTVGSGLPSVPSGEAKEGVRALWHKAFVTDDASFRSELEQAFNDGGSVQKGVRTFVRNIAYYETLNHLGYEAQYCGARNWGRFGEHSQELADLARDLGTSNDYHCDSNSDRFDKILLNVTRQVREVTMAAHLTEPEATRSALSSIMESAYNSIQPLANNDQIALFEEYRDRVLRPYTSEGI